MRSASAASLTILAAAASALRLPSAATRREIIGGSAALALGALAPAAVADSKKGYLTMSEVLEREKKEKQDQKLYGQFESLCARTLKDGRPCPHVLTARKTSASHSWRGARAQALPRGPDGRVWQACRS